VQQTLAEAEDQLVTSPQKTDLLNRENTFSKRRRILIPERSEHQDRALDQTVSCRPLTTDTQVQLQAWTCEFVVENVTLGRASHYQHLTTNVPYWVIRLRSTSLNLSNSQLTFG
jgi:hypothetical protein